MPTGRVKFFNQRIAALNVDFQHVKAFAQAKTEVLLEMLSFSHENQLERCPQVSVGGIFCYSRGELVFFLA
jgi:hypothetical protein